MKYSMESDKGRTRQINQDACFVENIDKGSCFAVLCDGMGGENAGEVAASVAVKVISERITEGWRINMTEASIENLLTTAISAANINIFDLASEKSEYKGMGSTVVAAVIKGGRLVVAHAGDSRAYIYTGKLTPVTKDHSYVQSLVDLGVLSVKQAENHPQKNIITRALGVGAHIDIDFTELSFLQGNKLLLCSDGLTNYVSEADISDVLKNSKTEQAAKLLVNSANINGGGDNITAVVISD